MSTPPALRDLLDGYLNASLVAMATRIVQPLPARDKASLLKLLSTELAKPARIKENLAGLLPADRALLEGLQRAGGRASFSAMTLWQHLGLLAAGGPGRGAAPAVKATSLREAAAAAKATEEAVKQVMGRLEKAGLCLGRGSRERQGGQKALGFGDARELIIPAEVTRQLPPPPVAPGGGAPAAETPRAVLSGRPEVGQRQLFLLWSWFWRSEPALLKSSGLLQRREVKRLAAALPGWVSAEPAEEEQPWLHWAHRLLEELALLRVRQDRCLGVAAIAEPFWRLAAEQRLERCWREAQSLPGGLALLGTGLSLGPQGATTGRGAVARAVDQLKVLAKNGAADAWWSVDDLGRQLAWADRDWLVPETPYAYGYGSWESSYIQNRYTNGALFARLPLGAETDLSGWSAVEVPALRCILAQLWYLGLVDLGLDLPESPTAPLPDSASISHLRLTPLSRHLLLGEQRPREAPPAEARIVLQPNLQILVMGPVPESRLWELENLADRVSADRAIVYQLSRESCYRAQQAGLDAAAMLGRLEAMTGAPAPQNVAQSLRDWQALHGRVVLRRQPLLVQVAPGAAGRLAEAAPGKTLEALGEGYFLLHNLKAFRTLAERQDQVLEWEPASKIHQAPIVQMAPDGRLTPLVRCLDPRALGNLQLVAEGDTATGWQMTPASVRRARQQCDADAALLWESLQELCGEPPPEARLILQRGLSAGGRALRYCGSFVELADGAAREALAALPALAGRLQEPAFKGPVVWVADEDLAALEAGLAELGLVVEDRGAAGEPAAGGPRAAGSAAPERKRRGRPPKGR